VIDAATLELEPVCGTRGACRLTGKSRATLHRHRHPQPPKQGPHRLRVHPAALTAAEQAAVLSELRSARFVDKSPAQVWATLLDEGTYLCSVSTMYRLLRGHGEVRERRRQATHPPRVKPELVARGPNEVWSWDATRLAGPFKGVWFTLLVMLDIYSRKAIHWIVVPRESKWRAKQFQLDAIAANDGVLPRYIHADNGGPMTSQPVSALLISLDVIRSHSRPHVSNDNPYSESNFKTLKYCPAFPERFTSLQAAQRFCDAFFTYYNTVHRHSGIGLHTPATVHDGTAHQIRADRATILTAAYTSNPSRFRRPPVPPALPAAAWINEPPKENINTELTA
jgi:transposase InsO family protein